MSVTDRQTDGWATSYSECERSLESTAQKETAVRRYARRAAKQVRTLSDISSLQSVACT